jgi:hypothetical protein
MASRFCLHKTRPFPTEEERRFGNLCALCKVDNLSGTTAITRANPCEQTRPRTLPSGYRTRFLKKPPQQNCPPKQIVPCLRLQMKHMLPVRHLAGLLRTLCSFRTMVIRQKHPGLSNPSQHPRLYLRRRQNLLQHHISKTLPLQHLQRISLCSSSTNLK